jgi:hypothetical protein
LGSAIAVPHFRPILMQHFSDFPPSWPPPGIVRDYLASNSVLNPPQAIISFRFICKLRLMSVSQSRKNCPHRNEGLCWLARALDGAPDRRNECFQVKKSPDACRRSSNAIQQSPRTSASDLSNLYATLSATQMILELVPETVQSATNAIECDRSNSKAYVRRAAVCSESKALQEAFNDFEIASRMQPGEVYLHDRLETTRRRLPESGRSPVRHPAA